MRGQQKSAEKWAGIEKDGREKQTSTAVKKRMRTRPSIVASLSPDELEEAKELARKTRREDIKRHREQRLIRQAAAASYVDPVKRELAQRELARRRLLYYVLRFNPAYLAGWVHKDLCMRLEQFLKDVEAGLSPRLMIQMPPRHGKSTLASIEFPSWGLGLHPEWEFIVCSYADSLAIDFSYAVRDRIRDKDYEALFPAAKLDPDNQNVKGWKTKKPRGANKAGGFLPAGVRAGVTGKGAHVLIIDDPVKNAEEADSETTREANHKWYTTTAYTRLAPGGGVLIIQTRWHMDDLSGRLERLGLEGEGDVFEVVRYPAIAVEDEPHRKRGQPLHPERYSLSQLKAIQRAVGPRTWSALYQQNPVPDEGALFQRSMVQYYRREELPEKLTRNAAWDLAIGQKNSADWTVGITGGSDILGRLWITDMRRDRMDSKQMVDEICDGFVKHEPAVIGIEKDKIVQALGPYLDDEIDDRRLYKLYYEELKPQKDKVARARTLQGLMRQGKVMFPHPEEAPWVETLISELMQFPYGRHDDCVDALTWLAILHVKSVDPEPRSMRIERRASWRDKLKLNSRKSPMSA